MNEHEADGRRFTHFPASPPLNSAMHALQRREKEREREGAGLHLTSTTEFVLVELNLSERATSGKVGGNGSPINTLTSPRLSDRLIVHAHNFPYEGSTRHGCCGKLLRVKFFLTPSPRNSTLPPSSEVIV